MEGGVLKMQTSIFVIPTIFHTVEHFQSQPPLPSPSLPYCKGHFIKYPHSYPPPQCNYDSGSVRGMGKAFLIIMTVINKRSTLVRSLLKDLLLILGLSESADHAAKRWITILRLLFVLAQTKCWLHNETKGHQSPLPDFWAVHFPSLLLCRFRDFLILSKYLWFGWRPQFTNEPKILFTCPLLFNF